MISDEEIRAAYAEFRLYYRQRTKPWEALAPWEQEGWRDFMMVLLARVREAAP